MRTLKVWLALAVLATSCGTIAVNTAHLSTGYAQERPRVTGAIMTITGITGMRTIIAGTTPTAANGFITATMPGSRMHLTVVLAATTSSTASTRFLAPA